jgi:hypothetical protein
MLQEYRAHTHAQNCYNGRIIIKEENHVCFVKG